MQNRTKTAVPPTEIPTSPDVQLSFDLKLYTHNELIEIMLEREMELMDATEDYENDPRNLRTQELYAEAKAEFLEAQTAFENSMPVGSIDGEIDGASIYTEPDIADGWIDGEFVG